MRRSRNCTEEDINRMSGILLGLTALIWTAKKELHG